MMRPLLKQFRSTRPPAVLSALTAALLALATDAVEAGTLCAVVKMKIDQPLTFERQAFDAHMEITNSLPSRPLTGLNVAMKFTDGNGGTVAATTNPNDLTASFFLRLDSVTGTQDIAGQGTVGPQTTAAIRWLIIPAPGAAASSPTGKLYLVGATINYIVDGSPETIAADPASIFVKPQPLLTLDYFIPAYVIGDDPTTTEIEPVEPFALGVRVQNSGLGPAYDVAIDSAQPRITENRLRLLIDFQITGAAIGESPVQPSLLLNFGTIAPQSAVVGRWTMTASLAGRFTDFTINMRHGDELGGAVTALVTGANAHFLVHEVLVDSPGRDQIRDFLATYGNGYRVYESDNFDFDVIDQSPNSSLTLLSSRDGIDTYNLTTPRTAGFSYVKVADPALGRNDVVTVTRNDGIVLQRSNAWYSKTFLEGGSTSYWFSTFDANSTGQYTVVARRRSLVPQAPVIGLVRPNLGVEGVPLGFLVEASDPNGTTPTLTTGPLPVGAAFTDRGDGTGTFDWTPRAGQAGTYFVLLNATDGTLVSSRSVVLTINPAGDRDGDALPDAWEIEYFGDLSHDGTADTDRDAVSDREELIAGTDPTVNDLPPVPDVPRIAWPASGQSVQSARPSLAIASVDQAPDRLLRYEFEVFADEALKTLACSTPGVEETPETTVWEVPDQLHEDHTYWWRVRSKDGTVASEWTYGSFSVNQFENNPAPVPLAFPPDAAVVAGSDLELEIAPSLDPEGAPLTYRFSVFSDQSGETLVARSPLIKGDDVARPVSWQVNASLPEGEYYWTAVARDEAQSDTTVAEGSFRVDRGLEPLRRPQLMAPRPLALVAGPDLDLKAHIDGGPTPGDRMFFEVDRSLRFDSADRQFQDVEPDADGVGVYRPQGLAAGQTYHWRVRLEHSEGP